MYIHFRGTTFQFIGQMQDDGVPVDLTDCTLQATVFDPSGLSVYGVLVISPVDLPNGLIDISYPDTSQWPVGKARIDFLLQLATGETIASPPDWFKVAQSPMVG